MLYSNWGHYIPWAPYSLEILACSSFHLIIPTLLIFHLHLPQILAISPFLPSFHHWLFPLSLLYSSRLSSCKPMLAISYPIASSSLPSHTPFHPFPLAPPIAIPSLTSPYHIPSLFPILGHKFNPHHWDASFPHYQLPLIHLTLSTTPSPSHYPIILSFCT